MVVRFNRIFLKHVLRVLYRAGIDIGTLTAAICKDYLHSRLTKCISFGVAPNQSRDDATTSFTNVNRCTLSRTALSQRTSSRTEPAMQNK